MWADINGERKKVACGPCIRGHRSSKCDHKDRVLVEVRKPGRPLSSCPHPSGSCSCERVVINYTIPKTASECACPSERAQPVASVVGTTSRIQKARPRKLTNSLNPLSLERAIKASQDAETDSSSLLTRTPTNPSFAPSDRSASNGASPPSSASSTPRLPPSPSRKPSSDVQLSDAVLTVRPPSSNTPRVSDCCKPKATRQEPERAQPQSDGSCCSGRAKETPKPVQNTKSCCSGPSQSSQANLFSQMNGQPAMGQNYANFPQFQQHGQYNGQQYSVNPAFNYTMPGNMGMNIPFGFTTPIYNHMASGYQQPPSTPMTSAGNGASHAGTHVADHNCHCGDSCSCFGCAAHPNNATMTEYVRMMHRYMSTGGFGTVPPPTYDLPFYTHHAGFGAEAASNMAYNLNPPTASFAPFGAGQMTLQANVNATMSIPHTSVNSPNLWQQTPIPVQDHNPTTTASYFNMVNTRQERPTQMKQEESAPSPTFTDSPSEGKDDDAATLSPSSYFWQELVLPGCNDATGTCQCGDGCECVGCLTHGGHNGVPLEDPATTEQNTFSNFMTGNDTGPNRAQFMTGAFSEDPT